MSEWDVLLAIHYFVELRSLANNAKIRSSLKFQLIPYKVIQLFYASQELAIFVKPLITIIKAIFTTNIQISIDIFSCNAFLCKHFF